MVIKEKRHNKNNTDDAILGHYFCLSSKKVELFERIGADTNIFPDILNAAMFLRHIIISLALMPMARGAEKEDFFVFERIFDSILLLLRKVKAFVIVSCDIQ